MLTRWQWFRDRDSEAFRHECGLWMVTVATVLLFMAVLFLNDRDGGGGRGRPNPFAPVPPGEPLSVPKEWLQVYK